MEVSYINYGASFILIGDSNVEYRHSSKLRIKAARCDGMIHFKLDKLKLVLDAKGQETMEFFLNVFTKFAEFSDKNICH